MTITKIANYTKPLAPINKLVGTLNHANDMFRIGEPIMSDSDFDLLETELKNLDPNNAYFDEISDVTINQDKSSLFKHVLPMLSTDKAFLEDEVIGWVNKAKSHQAKVGSPTLTIRATSKLDGIASYYDVGVLATRGQNGYGNNISWMLEQGLVIKGDSESEGVGEIVVRKDYFKQNLAEHFIEARGFVAGIANADELSTFAKKAFADGAIELVRFDNLNNAIEIDADTFLATHLAIEEKLINTIYETDGVVYEVVEPEIRKSMGSGSHHHNYQIAKKRRGEEVETTINDVTEQVGKSGVITPVLELEPVVVGGVTISRVTASNYRNYINKGLGKGAKIKVTRSGDVIPFLTEVIEKKEVSIIDTCPCCEMPVAWSNTETDLLCSNDMCSSRIAQMIKFHFNAVGIKGIGKVIANRLVAHNVSSIEQLYSFTLEQWIEHGVSDGVARNIMAEIERAQQTPLEDYRFLASMGISDLGKGSSKKLLSEYYLAEALSVPASSLINIKGFGEIVSSKVAAVFNVQRDMISRIANMFSLIQTIDENEKLTNAPVLDNGISRKTFCFTGKCSVPRPQLEQKVIELGGFASSSINKKTDYLVCGEKVGAAKINKAEKNGCKVITEADFLNLI